MKRFQFNKPMVESKYPPQSKDILWVDIEESTGELKTIKEFKNNNWETILEKI